MRIGRTIIIPTILALGAAGSILVGSAAPAVASQAPNAHVQSPASTLTTGIFYHA
jgi:hypothetical protein